jgi:hypothetical protein
MAVLRGSKGQLPKWPFGGKQMVTLSFVPKCHPYITTFLFFFNFFLCVKKKSILFYLTISFSSFLFFHIFLSSFPFFYSFFF